MAATQQKRPEMPAEFREVYERQQKRADAGLAPYDEVTMTHVVLRPSSRGVLRWVMRPVADSIEEAQQKRRDYFHPQHGLLWGGTKKASDHSPAEPAGVTEE